MVKFLRLYIKIVDLKVEKLDSVYLEVLIEKVYSLIKVIKVVLKFNPISSGKWYSKCTLFNSWYNKI